MRWYEQNIELSEVLNFIQSLSDDDKLTVAKYLLQIVINECNIDFDKEISKSADVDYSYNRWYDEILDLSSAMEFLKNLPKNKQDYVVNRFISDIVIAYAKKEIY